MEEQLIEFKTAKLAKEKGFNEETLYYFRSEHSLGKNTITYRTNTQMNVWDDTQEKWSAPTQSLLQKWLRDEHNIYVTAMPHEDSVFFKYNTRVPDKALHTGGTRLMQYEFEFKTYEEALEEGLQEALKLI